MSEGPAPGSHEQVLQELGRRIAGGQLAPGTVLTLADLEADFGASRTVVREAVRVLEDHGLLQSRRRVGITVRERSAWDCLNSSVVRWRLDGPARHEQLVELMELRVAVEPVAARLAALRASPQQKAELSRLAEAMRYLGSRGEGASKDYLQADIAFHSLLLTSSGNALLAQLADAVAEILTARTRLGLTPATPDADALDGHLQAAAGVEGGDEAAAEAGARTYVAVVSLEVGGESTVR